jgi:DNA-binding CsgD family transcriptional regulator
MADMTGHHVQTPRIAYDSHSPPNNSPVVLNLICSPHSNATKLVERLLDDLMASNDDTAGVLIDMRRGGFRCLIVREEATGLSPRELEIARMVAQGHPSKRIANTLQISSFTVNSHLRRIFTKLGVTNRAAMVARLTQQGFVDLSPLVD